MMPEEIEALVKRLLVPSNDDATLCDDAAEALRSQAQEIERLKADLIAANEQIMKDAQDYTRVRAENEKLREALIGIRDCVWSDDAPDGVPVEDLQEQARCALKTQHQIHSGS